MVKSLLLISLLLLFQSYLNCRDVDNLLVIRGDYDDSEGFEVGSQSTLSLVDCLDCNIKSVLIEPNGKYLFTTSIEGSKARPVLTHHSVENYGNLQIDIRKDAKSGTFSFSKDIINYSEFNILANCQVVFSASTFENKPGGTFRTLATPGSVFIDFFINEGKICLQNTALFITNQSLQSNKGCIITNSDLLIPGNIASDICLSKDSRFIQFTSTVDSVYIANFGGISQTIETVVSMNQDTCVLRYNAPFVEVSDEAQGTKFSLNVGFDYKESEFVVLCEDGYVQLSYPSGVPDGANSCPCECGEPDILDVPGTKCEVSTQTFPGTTRTLLITTSDYRWTTTTKYFEPTPTTSKSEESTTSKSEESTTSEPIESITSGLDATTSESETNNTDSSETESQDFTSSATTTSKTTRSEVTTTKSDPPEESTTTTGSSSTDTGVDGTSESSSTNPDTQGSTSSKHEETSPDPIWSTTGEPETTGGNKSTSTTSSGVVELSETEATATVEMSNTGEYTNIETEFTSSILESSEIPPPIKFEESDWSGNSSTRNTYYGAITLSIPTVKPITSYRKVTSSSNTHPTKVSSSPHQTIVLTTIDDRLTHVTLTISPTSRITTESKSTTTSQHSAVSSETLTSTPHNIPTSNYSGGEITTRNRETTSFDRSTDTVSTSDSTNTVSTPDVLSYTIIPHPTVSPIEDSGERVVTARMLWLSGIAAFAIAMILS
ncbi:uncharacterized protein J8A68_004552 [[Candida] subhashii]|uniref:Hyphally-regulated cell wall protein N-terminal domain-containing protein n=1 Tax=[Candida] subhashii TaxID=561895 RepID=A0A8J5Q5U1_9ASCO|nr:uncharacterized protein J8A68_004552 [[Candida] subhashii]KAG7661949.1 hypothetical protein J8A68_004552 [[Candida] subhashii]